MQCARSARIPPWILNPNAFVPGMWVTTTNTTHSDPALLPVEPEPGLYEDGGGGGGGRGASEGKGPQRRPQERLDRRLEEVDEAVGGGYCRLQMPLRPALGVRGTVAVRRLGALEGGGFTCGPWCPGGSRGLSKLMFMK